MAAGRGNHPGLLLTPCFVEYSIVRVDRDNYLLFDEMVFYRENGRERNESERSRVQTAGRVYGTLKDKNLHVFAARTGQKFVGWISAVYIPKISWTDGNGHLYVDELWVDPDYRKNGIASALLRKADAVSRELNTLGLRLYVNSDNAGAVSLYRKCGYKNKGEALFMEK